MVHAGCDFVASIHQSRAWMLGSFWIRAMEYICAQSRPQFILSSERILGEWSLNPCYLQGKNHLCQRLRGGSNPRCCITQDSEPNTLLTELFQPHDAAKIISCAFVWITVMLCSLVLQNTLLINSREFRTMLLDLSCIVPNLIIHPCP